MLDFRPGVSRQSSLGRTESDRRSAFLFWNAQPRSHIWFRGDCSRCDNLSRSDCRHHEGITEQIFSSCNSGGKCTRSPLSTIS
ncbi:hypothetical protein BDM02DRAFT_1545052 [Thelephora ganbajun]|uniref:Uncharacterized protein n=1 Tax=Thelephora ganbajun TaxID=370292 RepID=A0ACB6Z131_THEGA|nr:hypothetical protein BDM02DRAFT_1545052 [Thelephora ganbajun]